MAARTSGVGSAERRCADVQPEEITITHRLREELGDALSILKTVLIVTAAMFLLNGFVIANAVIPTSSMAPAIEPEDRVIGFRFLRDYQRGDIIVFNDPDVEGRYLIKRIIGMPGDRLAFLPEGDGTCSVSINGVKLEEPYLAESMLLDQEFASLTVEIPADSYFCMGDNRNNSNDARYWEHKLITKDEIIAKAVFRYWPAGRAGMFARPEYQSGTQGASM